MVGKKRTSWQLFMYDYVCIVTDSEKDTNATIEK